MFIFYNSTQSRISYLIQFSVKYICRYLTGSNTVIVRDACKTWDHKENQKPLFNVPFLFAP